MDWQDLLALVETLHVLVGDSEHGMRLDALVLTRTRWASRTKVQDWIRAGSATVDGKTCLKPATRLRLGTNVRVKITKTPRDLLSDTADLLKISWIVDDEAIGIVAKPHGIPVHPAGGNIRRTLLAALYLQDPDRADRTGLWLGHRLDKDTSGLVLVARSKAMRVRLADAFQRRLIRRLYRAEVRGSLRTEDQWHRVDARLTVVQEAKQRTVVDPAGALALTLVRTLEVRAETTLIALEAVTGRTHQLRVHMAHLGHPIVGDPLHDPLARDARRMGLHAHRLWIPQSLIEGDQPTDVTSFIEAFEGAEHAREPGLAPHPTL